MTEEWYKKANHFIDEWGTGLILLSIILVLLLVLASICVGINDKAEMMLLMRG